VQLFILLDSFGADLSTGDTPSVGMETVYRDDIKCLDTVQPHLADYGRLLLASLQGEPLLAPPGISKANSAVTIFDWDDTILCTSFLSSLDFPAEMPVNVKPLMQVIEDQASSLLLEALALGPVYIVTNAVDGWVMDSAAQHLPGLLPLLSRVTVISARGAHAHLYPDSPGLWKICAFFDLLNDIDFHAFQDIIVIGDSFYEMVAGEAVRNVFADVRVKLVKFKENPSAEVLSQQLTSLLLCFKELASTPIHNLFWRFDEGSNLELHL